MEYRGYSIEPNENFNQRHPSFNYLFHNLDDCDESGGSGQYIEDCKEQIDERIEQREQ